MLKLWVKLMVLLLLLALVGPFFIRGPDGESLIGLDEVRRELSDIRTGIATRWNGFAARFRRDAEPLPVYRWQDESGNWHFSDTANPDGTSELIYVDPDSNVIPSSEAVGAPQAPDEPQAPDANQLLNKIRNPLDEAHKAKQAMEERGEEIEQRSRDE